MKIAIISDIHEDVDSLKKTMSILEKKAVDEIVCLGDIVGFSVPYYNYVNTRNASECLKIVKANCNIVVAGNHDYFEAKKIPFHNANFYYQDNWYNLDYKTKKKLSKGQIWLHEENSLPSLISKTEKEFLYNLPEFITVNYDNIRMLFSHFIYPDILGTRADFIRNENSFTSHLDFLEEQNCELGFCGHAHTEGVLNFTKDKTNLNKFGKITLKHQLQGFLIPCIAKGKQCNGFVILDTKTMILETISLKNGNISQYFTKKTIQ